MFNRVSMIWRSMTRLAKIITYSQAKSLLTLASKHNKVATSHIEGKKVLQTPKNNRKVTAMVYPLTKEGNDLMLENKELFFYWELNYIVI